MTFIVSISLSLSLKMLQCSRYQQVFKLNNEYHETVRFWCISFHILLLGWHLWIYTEQIIHSKSVLILCCCTAWWGAGVVVCLQRGADLHMAQLMPLPLAVSCFSKIQIGFTFLVPAHPGSPEQRAVKRVYVCSEERIRNGAKKLEKSRTTVQQGRLDNFFQVVSVTTTTKRKVTTVTRLLCLRRDDKPCYVISLSVFIIFYC